MRKISTVLTVLLAMCSISASYDYTYSGMDFGYGYSYYDNGSHHAADIGFSAGYTAFEDGRFYAFGTGTRLDMLIENEADTPISVTTLIGPEFVFPFTDVFSLRVLAGPSFNIMDRGDGSSVFSIAPAADVSCEFTIPGFESFAISLGSAVYGQIGIEKLMFGVTVQPYASMILRFGFQDDSENLIIY